MISTCANEHIDEVKSLGAQHVFDYRDPDVVNKIKNVAPNLKYAFDTIGAPTTSCTASKALDKDSVGDRFVCTVRPGKGNTEDVDPGTEVSDVLVWRAFPKAHRFRDLHFPVHCIRPFSYFQRLIM